jgi:hypothetical protein
MTNGKFIRKLLGLVGLRVGDFWFKHCLKELHLHVKPHKNGARVVWVGVGKVRKTIDPFFNKELSDYQKKNIQWAGCDI